MAHVDHNRGRKQHAFLAEEKGHAIRPRWVHDDEDWARMQACGSGELVCPQPGCSTRFAKPRSNEQGTRWLQDLPHQSCTHPPIARPEAAGGGGPMSAQHRWLQGRIARVCEVIGHPAIVEHGPTKADVYVPDGPLAIEVQRWATDYEQRTRARTHAEASVLWLMPEQEGAPHTLQTRRALFELPAARVGVRDRLQRTRPLEPWLRPAESRAAVLVVYATVGQLNRDRSGLRTRPLDMAAFLREVLSGARRWYPPGTPGLPTPGGAWVLERDLELIRPAQRVAPVVVDPGVGPLAQPAPAPPTAPVPPAPATPIEVPAAAVDSDPVDEPPAAAPEQIETSLAAPDRSSVHEGIDSAPVSEENPVPAPPRPLRESWWQRLTRWFR